MLYGQQDSQQLEIEPPKQEKAKMSALMSKWELTHNLEEDGVVKFYLIVSDVYLRNLIAKREEPSFTNEQKRRLGDSCIINDSFVYEWMSHDGHHCNKQQYRGELTINYSQYRGLEILMTMGELELGESGYFFAKMHYYNSGETQLHLKTYHLNLASDSFNTYKFLIEEKDLETFLRPRLAIELAYHKQFEQEKVHLGIRNEGNTCYQNSILQILFFLRPLRKIVLQEETDNKTVLALREIFIEMMNPQKSGFSKRSIDAERLILAYGRFSDHPRRQQDIHEYLLGFFEQLEGACPYLQQLWQGGSRQQLRSQEQDKQYSSNINQQFTEIDIHMEDQKGNTFAQLIQPLRMMLEDDKVDDKIDTDQHGKISVVKCRRFTSLPNIIFMNLKRYQYNKEKGRPSKVLADLCYPLQINLSFLMDTPTGDDQYVLYALAVHRGQTSNSGHYFSLVNTSQNMDRPHWCRFNDSQVFVSSEEAALSFTGGKRHTIVWSIEFNRFVEKEYISEQTAYLLVYIRKDKFQQYQQIKVTIPRSYLMTKRKMHAVQIKPQTTVQVFVMSQEYIDIFGEVATISIPLCQEGNIFSQLKQIQKNYLGCTISSIWKVNKMRKKVKRLIDFADVAVTPARIFNFRRGHHIPDYLLVVPFKHIVFRTIESEINNREQALGLVKVSLEQGETRPQIRVVVKHSLEDFIIEEEKKLEKKGSVEEKEAFMRDWNDFCTLTFKE